jgi:uncharacterized protein
VGILAPDERLSLDRCREVLERLWFIPGDTLISNAYTPLVRIIEDTSPGRHDTLIASCSAEMYRRVGAGDSHRNCEDNFREATAEIGFHPLTIPAPWNLFMSAPVDADGKIEYRRPELRPGGRVVLCAEAPLVAVFSACPDDHYPTNGGDGTPRDVEIIVRHPRS